MADAEIFESNMKLCVRKVNCNYKRNENGVLFSFLDINLKYAVFSLSKTEFGRDTKVFVITKPFVKSVFCIISDQSFKKPFVHGKKIILKLYHSSDPKYILPF